MESKTMQSTSAAGTLCQNDVKRVLRNFLICNVPNFLAVLFAALAAGADTKTAVIGASATFFGTLSDLVKKLMTDNT
jgi:hypothetical protein